MAEVIGKKMVSQDFSKNVYAGVGAVAAGAGVVAGLSSDGVDEVIEDEVIEVTDPDNRVVDTKYGLDEDAASVLENETESVETDALEEVEVESVDLSEQDIQSVEAIDVFADADSSMSDSFLNGSDSLEYDVQADSLYNEDGTIM